MRVPLEITFGKSSSVHYARVVQLAQAMRGYRVSGTNKDPVHTVAL
jgi:hypothetical protein